MTDTSINKEIKADYSKPLSVVKQERFAQLYVNSPFELADIYREAGYKEGKRETMRKNASRLLRTEAVRGRIDWLIQERNERLGRDGMDVINGLYEMRDRCAGGQLVRDRQGKPIKVLIETGDGEREFAVVWKSDVQGFLRASELLAKFHGLLVEKSENVNVNIDKALDEKAQAIIAGLKYQYNAKQGKAKIDKVIETDYPTDDAGYIDDKPKSDYVVTGEAES